MHVGNSMVASPRGVKGKIAINFSSYNSCHSALALQILSHLYEDLTHNSKKLDGEEKTPDSRESVAVNSHVQGLHFYGLSLGHALRAFPGLTGGPCSEVRNYG